MSVSDAFNKNKTSNEEEFCSLDQDMSNKRSFDGASNDNRKNAFVAGDASEISTSKTSKKASTTATEKCFETEALLFLDVETTGTSPNDDRIIEIGCVKVDNIDDISFFEKMNTFSSYVKSDIKVKKCSFKVHGISDEFLADKPTFSMICNDLLEFIENRTIVAHNSSFDMSFLNAELVRIGLPPLTNKVIDSLQVAKRMYPGSPAGIDALIARFKMPTRALHSAREDAEVLARIYAQMTKKKDCEIFPDIKPANSAMDDIQLCNSIIAD